MKTRTIRIYGKEQTNPETNGKYVRYSYTPNGEKFYDVVFMDECQITPKKNQKDFLLVTIPNKRGAVSKKAGKLNEETGKVRNDTLFIYECLKVVQDTDYIEKRDAERQAEIDAIFSEDNDLLEGELDD